MSSESVREVLTNFFNVHGGPSHTDLDALIRAVEDAARVNREVPFALATVSGGSLTAEDAELIRDLILADASPRVISLDRGVTVRIEPLRDLEAELECARAGESAALDCLTLGHDDAWAQGHAEGYVAGHLDAEEECSCARSGEC